MKLPWLAERVVLASTALTPAQKLLWMQYRALDQGDAGAFIGEVAMGQRLGMGADNVKKQRRVLVRAGLLRSETVTGRRTASWFVLWPATIPLPTSGRVDPAQIAALADDLDGWIRTGDDGDGSAADRGTTVPRSKGASLPRQGYHSTPIERKGGPTVPPTGVPQSPPIGVPPYPQSSKKRSGAESVRGSSVVPDEDLTAPPSALAGARTASPSGERSGERGTSVRRAGPEHIGQLLDRATGPHRAAS